MNNDNLNSNKINELQSNENFLEISLTDDDLNNQEIENTTLRSILFEITNEYKGLGNISILISNLTLRFY